MEKLIQGVALFFVILFGFGIPSVVLMFIMLAWDEIRDEYGGYADAFFAIPEVDCWMGAVNACSDVVVWIIGMGVVVYAFFRFFRFIWNMGGNAR